MVPGGTNYSAVDSPGGPLLGGTKYSMTGLHMSGDTKCVMVEQSGSQTFPKVTEGVSGQQGISGHGPSFRYLGAVFANNCTALESSKVGYACALTEELLMERTQGT